jgi:amino acid transporter
MKTACGILLGLVVSSIVIVVGFSFLIGFLMPLFGGAGDTASTWQWDFLMLVMIAIGTIIGGQTCRRIAGSMKAVAALAALVIAYGGASAAWDSMTNEAPPVNATAAPDGAAPEQDWTQPFWTLIAYPLVGAAGVMLGGGFVGRKREPELLPANP